MISVSDVSNIVYVEDKFPTDDVGKKLFEECDKELKDSFNIEDLKDLGEYKTLLYAKFNCSRETAFGLIGINLEDEKNKREQENKDNLSEIFIPYGTSYTKSGDDNKAGRNPDKDSKNPDKQIEDKTRNNT